MNDNDKLLFCRSIVISSAPYKLRLFDALYIEKMDSSVAEMTAHSEKSRKTQRDYTIIMKSYEHSRWLDSLTSTVWIDPNFIFILRIFYSIASYSSLIDVDERFSVSLFLSRTKISFVHGPDCLHRIVYLTLTVVAAFASNFPKTDTINFRRLCEARRASNAYGWYLYKCDNVHRRIVMYSGNHSSGVRFGSLVWMAALCSQSLENVSGRCVSPPHPRWICSPCRRLCLPFCTHKNSLYRCVTLLLITDAFLGNSFFFRSLF